MTSEDDKIERKRLTKVDVYLETYGTRLQVDKDIEEVARSLDVRIGQSFRCIGHYDPDTELYEISFYDGLEKPGKRLRRINLTSIATLANKYEKQAKRIHAVVARVLDRMDRHSSAVMDDAELPASKPLRRQNRPPLTPDERFLASDPSSEMFPDIDR